MLLWLPPPVAHRWSRRPWERGDLAKPSMQIDPDN
jgi:hypothetical protein